MSNWIHRGTRKWAECDHALVWYFRRSSGVFTLVTLQRSEVYLNIPVRMMLFTACSLFWDEHFLRVESCYGALANACNLSSKSATWASISPNAQVSIALMVFIPLSWSPMMPKHCSMLGEKP